MGQLSLLAVGHASSIYRAPQVTYTAAFGHFKQCGQGFKYSNPVVVLVCCCRCCLKLLCSWEGDRDWE